MSLCLPSLPPPHTHTHTHTHWHTHVGPVPFLPHHNSIMLWLWVHIVWWWMCVCVCVIPLISVYYVWGVVCCRLSCSAGCWRQLTGVHTEIYRSTTREQFPGNTVFHPHGLPHSGRNTRTNVPLAFQCSRTNSRGINCNHCIDWYVNNIYRTCALDMYATSLVHGKEYLEHISNMPKTCLEHA